MYLQLPSLWFGVRLKLTMLWYIWDQYLVSMITKSFTFEKQQGLYHNKVTLSLIPVQRLGNQARNCQMNYLCKFLACLSTFRTQMNHVFCSVRPKCIPKFRPYLHISLKHVSSYFYRPMRAIIRGKKNKALINISINTSKKLVSNLWSLDGDFLDFSQFFIAYL